MMDKNILVSIIQTIGISADEVETAFAAASRYEKRAVAARFETDPAVHLELLSESIDPLSYKQCVLFGVRMAMAFDGIKTPVEEAP